MRTMVSTAGGEPGPVVMTPASIDAGTRIDAWIIERELGRGGMGAVYAVTHAEIGKRAALKVCHASVLGATFTADTFLREARIVHLIDHPGMCDVFAIGTFDRRPYLAMERLTGETLGTLLEEPLAHEQALDIMIALCEILSAAHAAGVIHRDLKLENVFVLDNPAGGCRGVKLLDWGIAHIIGEPDPMRGRICGTLTSVAPEQIRSDQITAAADVYALAVLAYQMLFGQPPFRSESDLELIQKHLRSTPPEPTALWPEIPDDLADLLGAMLAKDPERRPSLAEVRTTLEHSRGSLHSFRRRSLRWLAKLPSAMPTVSGRPRPLARARRHRMAYLALGAACLIASVASLLGA